MADRLWKLHQCWMPYLYCSKVGSGDQGNPWLIWSCSTWCVPPKVVYWRGRDAGNTLLETRWNTTCRNCSPCTWSTWNDNNMRPFNCPSHSSFLWMTFFIWNWKEHCCLLWKHPFNLGVASHRCHPSYLDAWWDRNREVTLLQPLHKLHYGAISGAFT